MTRVSCEGSPAARTASDEENFARSRVGADRERVDPALAAPRLTDTPGVHQMLRRGDVPPPAGGQTWSSAAISPLRRSAQRPLHCQTGALARVVRWRLRRQSTPMWPGRSGAPAQALTESAMRATLL